MDDQKNENDIEKEADKLIKEMKQVSTDFVDRTDMLVGDINKDIDSTEKDFKETERELKKFEKETVNEIDKAVIDFVS
jgi:peptidoglycan hydrolase CwlO-like protein